MINKIRAVWEFTRASFSNNGFDIDTAYQLKEAAKNCLIYIDYSEKNFDAENFEDFISDILGVYSTIISYHESIYFLCLAGHGLNSSVLLRTQLEAYLIFYYLISPKTNLKEVEERVNFYRDWMMVRMHLNSKKSKNFELFTINPEHASYLIAVEENYNFVKNKYKATPDLFKKLEESQSFLKDKKQVAKEADIESLYMSIFSETSATVHIADISDRKIHIMDEDFEGYRYEFSSNDKSMLVSGISNILLIKAMSGFLEFFEIPMSVKEKIFKKIALAKRDQAILDD